MRIVVLDGYAANPGDLDWEPLAALGDLAVHDRTPAAETVARAQGAEAVITNKTVLDADALAALPDLRYVGLLSTGTNVVDLEAAAARGVTVTNVPAYSTASVAQTAFALLLELTNRTALHSDAVHAGAWTASPDFCFRKAPLTELDGKTLGVVGFGHIGRRVAAIGRAFGMEIFVHTRTAREEPDVTFADLDTLFAEADAVSLHCPLTPQTEKMVNGERLARMKPTAFLINTGRGGLVDEAALAAALREERIAGAGLDVLSAEPPPADHPLLGAPNCVITPHIAWASRASRRRLLATVHANLRAFLDGAPVNVVT